MPSRSIGSTGQAKAGLIISVVDAIPYRNIGSNDMEYPNIQKVLHDPHEESAKLEIISTFDAEGENMYVGYIVLSKVIQTRVRGSTITEVMKNLEEECRKMIGE